MLANALPLGTCGAHAHTTTASRRCTAAVTGPASRSATRGSVVVRAALSAAAASTAIDNQAVRDSIKAVIADPNSPGGIGERGPTVVRLAWHSSGSYDKVTKTNGSNGATMRFKEELGHGANNGLDKPMAWLEEVKSKHPAITYADLYTLAGATAVELMGGPHISWKAGRVDELDPAKASPDGRLPDADYGSPPRTAASLRTVFSRMGFGDKELVALSGAHALGRCHAENSGYVGPWTATPTIFSNLYFKLLLRGGEFWTPDERYPKLQYKDPSGTLMMLPSDLVLIQDPEFKKYVEMYAKDKKLFFEDFAACFAQLMELGTHNLAAIA